MIDYHVHTRLCNHAEGTMETYVHRAIHIGLREICFMDHLTLQPFEQNLSMSPEEVALYFQALQRLKQRHRHSIQVKIGLEIDYNPEHTDLFQEIVERFSFDVIGGALHFPKGFNIVSRGSDWKHGNLSPDDVYPLYLEHLEKMLDCNYFDVVCHLDLVKKFGWKSSQSFDRDFNNLLLKIKQKNLTVEMNTGGYSHPVREGYPSAVLLKKCREYNIRVTLGSDAHHPDQIGRHYELALPLLYDAGYCQLTTFTRRQPETVAITEHECFTDKNVMRMYPNLPNTNKLNT
jgi:histidinol-phosphatase (PHP family)